MTMTSSPQILQSLRLQQQRHLKQTEIIKEKQRRSLLAREQRQEIKCPIAIPNSPGECPDTQEEMSVFRTMEECDSLLQILNKRAVTIGQREHGQPSSLQQIQQDNQDTSASQINGIKIAIDDKLMIEELVTHNNALRQHILQLLNELENKEQQLQLMRQKYDNLHDTVERCSQSNDRMDTSMVDSTGRSVYNFPMAINLDKLPALELPPLEMPKFDLDSLCDKSDKQEDVPDKR